MIKRLLKISIALLAVLSLAFAALSCGDNGGGGGPNNVTVTFNAGEGTIAGTFFNRVDQTIPVGGTITSPPGAILAEHDFIEWNTELDGSGTTLETTTTHAANTTYHAVWELAMDSLGDWDFSDINPAVAPDTAAVWVWTLGAEIFAAIDAAPPGSQIRLSFDATGGYGPNRDGWGIGSIGFATVAEDADVIGLNAPAGATFIYSIMTEVDWILGIPTVASNEEILIFVHVNNGDRLQRVELFAPREARNPGPRPGPPEPYSPDRAVPQGTVPSDLTDQFEMVGSLSFDRGYFGDPAAPAGAINAAGVQLIIDTFEALADHYDEYADGILRIFYRNYHPTAHGGWGNGWIHGRGGADNSSTPNSINVFGPATGPRVVPQDFYVDYLLSDIMRIINEPGPGANPLHIVMFNQQLVIGMQVWTQKENVIVPRGIMVDVAGVQQRVERVHGRSASIVYVLGGYQLTRTTGHRGGFSWFELDLGSRTLADFAAIEFDFQRLDTTPAASDGSLRLALLARNDAFPNASLANHPTGGSGQPFPNGSDHGYLAAGQVTAGMRDNPIASGDTGVHQIRLPITSANQNADPASFSGNVFLSIYEHTANGNAYRITNIRLVLPSP